MTNRADFLAMLVELETALRQGPKAGYPRRVCEITVCDDCDAGSESVVQWNLDQADIDMLRGALAANVTDVMVNRFLSWKLPEDFHPDAGISFSPHFNVEYNAKQGRPPQRHEPIGTNLLTATQARAMLEHVLAATAPKGWCIRHVDGRWRTLDTSGMPDWTDDSSKALCCRLREHADAFSAEDPDDVRIVEVAW